MKNPDYDPDHRRRREAGSDDDTPDGRKVAERLYGGLPTDSEKIDNEANGTSER